MMELEILGEILVDAESRYGRIVANKELSRWQVPLKRCAHFPQKF